MTPTPKRWKDPVAYAWEVANPGKAFPKVLEHWDCHDNQFRAPSTPAQRAVHNSVREKR